MESTEESKWVTEYININEYINIYFQFSLLIGIQGSLSFMGFLKSKGQ